MANKILAISPGTRTTGVALFINGQLTDWATLTNKEKWSAQKLSKVLHSLQDWADIDSLDAVAIKFADELPNSVGYIQLIGALNVLFEKQGIYTADYTLSDLKEAFGSNRKDNRRILIDAVVEKYPILKKECDKEKSNRNKYYYKVFEAVAAGHLLQLSF